MVHKNVYILFVRPQICEAAISEGFGRETMKDGLPQGNDLLHLPASQETMDNPFAQICGYVDDEVVEDNRSLVASPTHGDEDECRVFDPSMVSENSTLWTDTQTIPTPTLDFHDVEQEKMCLPNLAKYFGIESKALIIQTMQSWALERGFRLVQCGGKPQKGKLRFVCSRGRPSDPKRILGVPILECRNSSTQRHINGDLCKCMINVNLQVDHNTWNYGTHILQHNHDPDSDLLHDLKHRKEQLTPDMILWIQKMEGVSPKTIWERFYKFFPTAPLLSPQDLRNINGLSGGSNDAKSLLELLMKLKQEDDRWVVKYQRDAGNRLTHLFWMTPKQRARANDLYQIIIHDNTYMTNRFGLPFGIFSSVNRWVMYLFIRFLHLPCQLTFVAQARPNR